LNNGRTPHIENRLRTFLQEPWQNHNAFNADAVPVHEPSEKNKPKKMNIPRSVDKTTGKSFKSAFENVQSFEAS
jgi:hypothetical protein